MNSQRFSKLWNRCAGINDPNVDGVYSVIESRYSEPHRFYHTATHIDQCLVHLDGACASGADRDVAELSIWFHDVIYDSGARDNERRSADWFSECAKNVLPEKTINQVNQCIMSTTHQSLPVDNLSKLVVDVDLSGFGQDWKGFTHDGDNIRLENCHMSTADYVKGQISFMTKLVNRERIFSTEYFYSRYEASAQSNISKQLEIYYQSVD